MIFEDGAAASVYSYVGIHQVRARVTLGYWEPVSQTSFALIPHTASCVEPTVPVRLPGTQGCPRAAACTDRQLSLLSVSRNVPVNVLPPDFVTTLITPPPNRPNSADTPAVATVVS